MSKQISETSPPGFFGRLAIAAAHLLIPLHTGLILTYFILHAVSGNDSGFVEVLGFILPWLFIPSAILLPLALWQSSRNIMLLAGIPFALFLLTYGQLYLPRLPVTTASPVFKVMVYNVLRDNSRGDQITAVIKAHDPDIIGLHELESAITQYIESQLSGDYPYRRIEPVMGYGIFSRYPIDDYTVFRMADESWLFAQQCVLDIDGRKVTLINAHPQAPPIKGTHIFGLPIRIPSGIHSEYRDAELDGLLSHLEGVSGPLLLIGDFNLSDQEHYYTKFTEELGDAHRESGWGMGFSFANYRQLGIPIWRIDYVFHSPEMVSLHTTVGDFGGSDHRPVIAQLGFDE